MAILTENENDTEFQQSDEVTCDITEDVRNWSNEKIADEMLYSTLEMVKATFIVPFIFVIGFLGNLAFFLLLARVKTMRTLTNFYLANLAIADIVVLLVKIGHLTSSYHQSILVWSEPFQNNIECVANVFLCVLSYCASIMLITFINFDRYFAICKPVKYRLMKNKKRVSFISISVIWLVSAIFACPFTLANGRFGFKCIIWPSKDKYYNFPDYGRICSPFYTAIADIDTMIFTIPLPAILINIILYIKIVKKLKQPMGENGKNSNQKIKQRVTWMLLANSVIFFCCVTSSQILLMLMKFLDHSHTRMRNTAYILIMVNSAVNPIIYGLASPSYRRGFLKALGFAKNKVEPSESQESEKTRSTIAHFPQTPSKNH